MTPERKKKLRTLLRKKAAEELKKEQERKAEERLRVIAERCGTKADLDAASMDDLKKICQQYFDKWYSLEGEMFFLQREVILRDLHGRPEEDLPAVLRQVVQPRGRDVLPAARGHSPRPPDQRAHHLRQ